MHAHVSRLRNLWRRDAEQIAASQAQPRFATIASVDPDTHSVRVNIQPEGILSGWIPDASAMSAGGGFGIVAPPSIGDQVKVLYSHGDSDHPVVIGRVFSSVDMPPVSPVTGKSVQPGEFGVFLPGGAFLHGTGGGWHVKGPLIVDGPISSTSDVSDVHGSLDRLRGRYDDHTHPGVQTGNGATQATSKPDSE